MTERPGDEGEPRPDPRTPAPARPGRSRAATWAIALAGASVLAFVGTVLAVAASIADALGPDRPATTVPSVFLSALWLALALAAVVVALRARRVERDRGLATAAVVVAAVPVALVVGALGAARLS
ncbi:hypothetical protein [Cellulomonas sp.]|uniref:hypothetical protein n=1 Tax=Cellulomonas sp. TaxID=40001 RepID=UPI002812259A|nr:hypothetical protein [Cellulomonas sp.]